MLHTKYAAFTEMSMSKPQKVSPFANAFDYFYWDETNCGRCALRVTCDITDALEIAACTDGKIPTAIAERMGYDAQTKQVLPDCPELTDG